MYTHSKLLQNVLHFEGEVENLKENSLIYLGMALLKKSMLKSRKITRYTLLFFMEVKGITRHIKQRYFNFTSGNTVFKLYAGIHLCTNNFKQVLGFTEFFYFTLCISDRYYSLVVLFSVLFIACCGGINLLLAKPR